MAELDPTHDEHDDPIGGLDVEVAEGWTLADALAEDEAADAAAAAPATNGRATRPSGNIALIFLGVVTLVAVSALVLSIVLPAVFTGLGDVPDDALGPLTNVSLLGIGALSAVLGVKD